MTTRTHLCILDTNVVSDLRRERPSPELADWVDRQPPRSLAISFSTVFEIQYGAELARRDSPGKAASLEDWLDSFVLSGRFRVLRPCALSVRIRARMHATPALRGFLESRPGAHKPPNGEKLTIAAQAIVADAVVVTLNDRDFARIHEQFRLPGVLNPRSGEWTVTARPQDLQLPSRGQRILGNGVPCNTPSRRERSSRWDHGFAKTASWSAVRRSIAAIESRAL